jgi:serine/threonine protein kinase
MPNRELGPPDRPRAESADRVVENTEHAPSSSASAPQRAIPVRTNGAALPVSAEARSRPRSSGSLASRFGVGLISPLGILFAVPAPVVLVGLFLTALGEHALRASNLAVAEERMAEQARLVASSVTDALGQADPLLDRLALLVRGHDPSQPIGPFAQALADLLIARPGITFISASFSDGSYRAAYLDDDPGVHIQDYRVAASGTHARRYDLDDSGQLVLRFDGQSDYDPRQRDFYKLAVQRGVRTWTPPYSFYEGKNTGVTRTQALYIEREGKRALHAVLTVDFEINAMSAYLNERHLPGMRALLYQSDGTILAYTGTGAALPSLKDRAIKFTDLSDPLLTAFFQFARGPGRGEARFGLVHAGDTPYFAAIAPVRGDPSLAWSIAYLAPEHHFMRALRTYEQRSLAIGSGALVLSALLAFLLARRIIRAREEVASARADAREARKEARELGSYRLVACLGKGGMGEVWRAQHRLLAREAAIKLIKTDGGASPGTDRNQRFRREAEALAALRSRNTIELLDYGVAEDGTFFLVTELLDGMDLDSLLARHGPQPPARVVHFLIQACASLAEAHDAGLVHRDVKPANIFTCRAADEVDLIKVLDFGLVRATLDQGAGVDPHADAELLSGRASGVEASRLTQGDVVMGTPAFMAPEQALARAVDGRADLYALGAVAFFLLSGRLLFESNTAIGLLIAHMHEPLPDLKAQLPSDVPDALIDLLARCLAKAPYERPADARELAQALRDIPFAPDQRWTEQRAHAWWSAHRPRRTEQPTDDPPRELAVAPTITTG